MKQLVLILVLIITALASRAAASECWYFTGKMGGRVSVELFMEADKAHDDIVAGYIYYPRAKKPAPILVVGTRNGERFYLHEYLADGNISGNIDILLAESQGKSVAPRIEYGVWTNPKTGDTFSLESLKDSATLLKNGTRPAWWPGDPLLPASTQNIPGEYGFGLWNPSSQKMLGGTAEFREAGEDRVHFNIVNRWYSTAEGESRNHCPAVLCGNEFEYGDINDCGYGFRAIFFKRFVVIQTTTGADTLRCFGSGVTLAGVYIKKS